MPPSEPPRASRSRRRRRTPPPRHVAPAAQAYVSQGRAVAHAAHQQRAVARARRTQRQTAQARPLSARPVRPQRVGPTPAQRATARRSLGFNRNLGNLRPAEHRAAQRAQRAQQRVAPRPMPHVPVLQNPTRAQAQAAHDLIARAINRQVSGRTGRERQQSRDQVIREIQTDPRLKDVRRASSHYARALERRNAIAVSRGLQPNQTEIAADLRRVAGQMPRDVKPLSARPVEPQQTGTRRQQVASLRQAALEFGAASPNRLTPLSQRSLDIRYGRGAASAARARNQYRALAPPKARHVGIGPAQVNITPAVTRLGGAAAAALAQTSLNTGDIGPREFAANVGKDVRDLATGPFVGGYELGRGTYEAATGQGTRRLENLGRGVVEGTIDTFRHPLQHPLVTALTFAGGLGAVGRVGGALARGAGSTAESAGLRGALARAGSEVRPPIAYSADAARAGIRERRYSRDIIRKSVQVANDARREPLRNPDGSVVTVRRQGREVPVLSPRGPERVARADVAPQVSRMDQIERMGRTQADFLAARQQSAEYAIRDRANHEFRAKGVKGRNAQDLVALVVEGTIRSAKTFQQDLRTYRDMVAREIATHDAQGGVFRSSREYRDAKAQVARIDRLMHDKRVLRQIPKIVQVGEDLGRRLNMSESEAKLLGLMDPVRADRARLIHPGVLHLGAKHWTPEDLAKAGVQASDEALKHGALRRENGQFLSNRDVENVIRETGRDPRTVAYLPPQALGRSAFHRRFTLNRPTIGGQRARTGAQYRRGLTGANAQAVREQGVKLAVTTQKGRGVDQVISEHGLTRPDGKYFTFKEAEEYASRLAEDTGERLIPVRGVPARADAEMDKLARGQQSPTAMESLAERLFNDRLRIDDKGNARNVVLMPASIVERLQKHAAPSHDLVKIGQWVNRPFRSAVLPQPRWLFGNIAEPGIRLTVKGSGVNVIGLGADLIAAEKALRLARKSDDPRLQQAGAQMEAQIGMGLFVGNRGATVRRTLEELPGHDTYGKYIAKFPAIRHSFQFGRLLLNGAMAPANAFFRINRVVENIANRAAFGHEIRSDIRSFQGSYVKSLTLGRRATEEAMRGLMNTSTQRRYAVALHETLGKYNGFSPTMRALTQTFLPFIPWMLNATRFVFWTMPAHHTTKTALLQQASQTVQKDWEDIHKDTPPGNLRFAIPNGKGGWIDIARYTPWGAFTEAAGGGGFGGFTGQFTPQLGGVTSALEGRTPFGQELTAPPGEKAKPGLVALNSAVEAMVPYVAQIRRMREGGATGYSTSTVLHPETKPGTKHQSAVSRTFSPFAPTYLRAPTGGGGPAGPSTERAVRRAQRAASRGGQSDAALQRALKRARRRSGG